jgi:hypothetical protein
MTLSVLSIRYGLQATSDDIALQIRPVYMQPVFWIVARAGSVETWIGWRWIAEALAVAESQSTNAITSKVTELANKAVTNIAIAVMSRRKARF